MNAPARTQPTHAPQSQFAARDGELLVGNQRNRVFAYVRYMAILNEGAEPL